MLHAHALLYSSITHAEINAYCMSMPVHTLQLPALLSFIQHITLPPKFTGGVQAWDNIPEVFQGQDGCSDIRGKPHRAEADSLHVLHLLPIKKPTALWLSPSAFLSHSLTANYRLTPRLDLICRKKTSLFLSLKLCWSISNHRWNVTASEKQTPFAN